MHKHNGIAGQMVDAVNNTPLLSSLEWASLRSWYQTHGRHHLPWRHQATPWHVFLAETLLHRTRAEAVEAIYPRIVHEFPSPAVVVREETRWIDLRHSSASLLLAQGATMRTMMEQLGRSQINLTMNTYAHIARALLRDAADKLDEALGRIR